MARTRSAAKPSTSKAVEKKPSTKKTPTKKAPTVKTPTKKTTKKNDVKKPDVKPATVSVAKSTDKRSKETLPSDSLKRSHSGKKTPVGPSRANSLVSKNKTAAYTKGETTLKRQKTITKLAEDAPPQCPSADAHTPPQCPSPPPSRGSILSSLAALFGWGGTPSH